ASFSSASSNAMRGKSAAFMRRSSSSVTGAIAPQLLQPRVASAAAAVELVANRVLAVVVLMIFLGRIEGARHLDRRQDRLLEGLRFLERRLRGFRRAPLGIVVIEDRGAVLRAAVAELAVRHRRIDVDPEHVE